MPCKKKSISPLYFQMYTHLFTENRFPSVQMFEDVCVIFSKSYGQKKKTDWSVYDKLLRRNPSHCSWRTPSSQVRLFQRDLHCVKCPWKRIILHKVQLVKKVNCDVLWEQYVGSPLHSSLENPPGNGSCLNLCNIKKKKIKKWNCVQIQSECRVWNTRCVTEKFLVAYYKDIHFESVAEKTGGGWGETGNRLVCILAIVVCSRQTCKRRLRLLFEQGVVGITKGGGGMVPGRSWCYDEESLGSSHLAGVLVAEEQLCCCFHIPGFWGQGRYYCIL